MGTMETKMLVRKFLNDNMLMGDEVLTMSDDASFLGQNLLDSTGVLELVDFLEQSFGVDIEDGDIVPANLDTLSRISAFIDRKRASSVSAVNSLPKQGM